MKSGNPPNGLGWEKTVQTLLTKNIIIMQNINPYPFVNPIIVTKDNTIYDGQHRFEVCKILNAEISMIQLLVTSKDLKSREVVEVVKEIHETQRIALEKWFVKNNVDIKSQLRHTSSVDKMSKFLELKDVFKTNREYWEELRKAYQGSINNFLLSTEIRNLFSKHRPQREFLMNKKEQRFLKKLPDTITIYRGMSIEEFNCGKNGISWTLDKKVAQFFAEGHIHNYNNMHLEHTVKKTTINKREVIAYFGGRDENEIIYLERNQKAA